jgi:DNA mismatch repair protein MutS2
MKEFLHSFTKLEFDKVKKYIQRYAYSDLGREHLENLTPSSSLLEIRENQAVVSEMKRLLEANEAPPLDTIPDIRVSLQRSSIENYALTAQELHRIALVLETTQKLHQFLSRRKSEFSLLAQQVESIHLHKILLYNINQSIDENDTVKDSATKELGQIRKQIGEKANQLRKRLEGILKSVAEQEWAQDEIITTRDFRMVIPVKTEHKNRVPGFIHSSSASGATVFIEPTETLELNNDIRTLQFREQREIEKVLKELTDQVREVRMEIFENIRVLGLLDFVQAKARYSIEILGVEPNLIGDTDSKYTTFRLIDARHPILLQKHKRNATVPLNMEIEPDTHTILISGPNAGGKSVTLKTIGLLGIMAQSGCHIPAGEGSRLSVFNEIFVDMGDEQSIENDLSSFSSHLKNLKELVENITENSLVLLDEIGAGTDPMEGSSIAAVVLSRLTETGCTTVATTHHGTLKTFAHETPGIENAAMDFDSETLRPTYRLKMRIPGSSYAMEMAERIGFPPDLVQKAKELHGSDAYNVEKLLMDLQEQSRVKSEELEAIMKEKRQLTVLTEQYKEKNESLRKDLKQIKLRAIEEAEAIVSKANTTVEHAIKEIKEHAAEKDVVKTARVELKSLVQEVDKLREEFDVVVEQPTEFKPGDGVRLKDSNSTGEILEKVDAKHYLVLVGNLKIKVPKNSLILAQVKPVTFSKPQEQVGSNEVRREVDLRGMYGDEAIEAIERLFDEAIISGLRRVDLIHGKGTGALRKRVTEFLKKNAIVKSYRLGEWNEGGTGVTVVELK